MKRLFFKHKEKEKKGKDKEKDIFKLIRIYYCWVHSVGVWESTETIYRTRCRKFPKQKIKISFRFQSKRQKGKI